MEKYYGDEELKGEEIKEFYKHYFQHWEEMLEGSSHNIQENFQ